MHIKHGNRWCDIAKEVDGRTDNAIKNRYNSNLTKRLHEPQFAHLYKNFPNFQRETIDSEGNVVNTDIAKYLKTLHQNYKDARHFVDNLSEPEDNEVSILMI